MKSHALLKMMLCLSFSITLTACGFNGSNSSGPAVIMPDAQPNMPDAQPNSAGAVPTITGSPILSVTAKEAYSFKPVAHDPDGDTLSFSVSHLPSWARFNVQTGEITGTPNAANIGIYPEIQVAVSDGTHKVALRAFSIEVTSGDAPAALLSWTPPQRNVDGSTLKDLAGYQIHYGKDPARLNQKIQITDASTTAYVVSNLTSGLWYFGVSAINAFGVESSVLGPIAAEI